MTKFQRMAAMAALLATPALMATGCFADPKAAYNAARTKAFDLYTLGEDLERVGDHTRALDHYLQAVDLSPRPAFFYKAGHMHHTLGRADQAVFFFDRALELAPDYEIARTEKAVAQLKLEAAAPIETSAATAPAPSMVAADHKPAPPEQTSVAVAPPAPIVDQEPASPPPATTVAMPETIVAAPAGQGTEPSPVAEPVADVLAPQPGALAYEGLDRDQVRSALFPASTAGVRDLATERGAALSAIEAGRWDEAVRRWGYVLSQTPGDAEARREHARALHRSGRTARALEEFEAAAALAPDDAETQLRWANALAEAGDKAAAEAKYRRALELRPDDNRTKNNLAALCLDGARWQEAAELLEAVIASDAEFAPAHLNLAIALGELGGNRERRIDLLESYLELGGTRRAEANRMLGDLKAAKD